MGIEIIKGWRITADDLNYIIQRHGMTKTGEDKWVNKYYYSTFEDAALRVYQLAGYEAIASGSSADEIIKALHQGATQISVAVADAASWDFLRN